MRWLSGLFQKLRIRVAKGMTKSGGCLREEIPRAGMTSLARRIARLAAAALSAHSPPSPPSHVPTVTLKHSPIPTPLSVAGTAAVEARRRGPVGGCRSAEEIRCRRDLRRALAAGRRSLGALRGAAVTKTAAFGGVLFVNATLGIRPGLMPSVATDSESDEPNSNEKHDSERLQIKSAG